MHFGKWIDGENYTGNSRTQRSIDVQKWILECMFISPYKCLPWSIRELSIQVDKSHCSCIKIWSTICSAGHHTIVRTWRLWTRCRRGSPGSCLDWRLDYKETSYIMEIRFKVREGKFKSLKFPGNSILSTQSGRCLECIASRDGGNRYDSNLYEAWRQTHEQTVNRKICTIRRQMGFV